MTQKQRLIENGAINLKPILKKTVKVANDANSKKVRFCFTVKKDNTEDDNHQNQNKERHDVGSDRRLLQLNLFAQVSTKKVSFYVQLYMKKNGMMVESF